MAITIRVTGRYEQALRFLAKHGNFNGADPMVSTVGSMFGLGFNEILGSAWSTEAECVRASNNTYDHIDLVGDEPTEDTHEFDSTFEPAPVASADDLLSQLRAAGFNPLVIDGLNDTDSDSEN